MTIILFDDHCHNTLLPLTFTKPVSELLVGILTISRKWEIWLKAKASSLTLEYLQEKFPQVLSENNCFINGSVCPDEKLVEAIDKLSNGDALYYKETLLAVKLNHSDAGTFNVDNTSQYKGVNYTGTFVRIVFPEDIFKHNDE